MLKSGSSSVPLQHSIHYKPLIPVWYSILFLTEDHLSSGPIENIYVTKNGFKNILLQTQFEDQAVRGR